MRTGVGPAGKAGSAIRRRRSRLLVGLTLLLIGSVPPAALATSSGQRSSASATGCASSRTASAFGTNGARLDPQPLRPPIPCLVPTGFATMETHVAVTGDGSVVYEPAIVTPGLLGTNYVPGAPGPHPWSYESPGGLAVSPDQGADWNFVKPGGTTGAGTDNALYVDPATGRLFEELLGASGPSGGEVPPLDQTDYPGPNGKAIMLTSADDGKTWTEFTQIGFVFPENARFTAAPAAANQARTSGGYADVTYWCGNQNVGAVAPQAIADRSCYRSLDAGTTWELRSLLFTKLPASECGTSQPYYSAYDGFYPEGAPDGSLYVMVACYDPNSSDNFSSVYLARSTDEAGTWSVLQQPGSGGAASNVQLPVPKGATDPELRLATVNGQTVLVLAYQLAAPAGPQVRVQTATLPSFISGGAFSRPLQWSSPSVLTPPGLSSIDRWSVDVRGSELALSSIAGTASPSGAIYNGYLTMVSDVTAMSVIWTTMVNDPGMPLSTTAPQSAKDDFIGVTIGPDGTPWGSYFSPCSADPHAQTDPACEGAYFNGHPVNSNIQGGNDRGLVAHLLIPEG